MSSRPLLNAPAEYLEDHGPDIIAQLRSRIDGLQLRIAQLEEAQSSIKRDAVVALLNVLGSAMKEIAAGRFDISETPVTAGHAASKWDAIKRALKGRQAEVIELLLLHGPLNQSQIAANLGIDPSNVSKNIIPDLLAKGLVKREGGKIALRE